MNKILFVFVCFFAILLFPLKIIVHAETYIESGSVSEDALWDKAHSPYILKGSVNFINGSKLTIESGVEIKSETNIADQLPAIFINKGSLIIKGKSTDTVNIHGLDGISLTDSFADISHADIYGPGGLFIDRSKVVISTTTISDAWDAMNIKESQVYIRDSQIRSNTRGIRIEPEGMPDLVYVPNSDNVGGIGNFFEEINEGNTLVKISNSIINNNVSYSIRNVGTSTVEAVGNWWGSDGPVKAGENRILGFVNYDPWLNKEPDLISKNESVCCSNILFIPGFEGSRLYLDNQSLYSTSTNTLWEPNRNDDVRKLFMNKDGSSVNQGIYPGEPIGKALGIVGVYDKFINFLDSLKEKGEISEWKSFGYDWRKSIPEVVAGSVEVPENKSLINLVEDLASSSPTGKVKIIAHSNGGLVAKYLVKILSENSKENLIDSLISVAVPYLGTPEALLGLLHGDNQSVLGGLIVKQSVMRSLAENMPGIYSLLPSAGFFSKIYSPTVVFASTTVEGINDGSYSREIDSINEQNDFLVDSQNIRLDPSSNDTEKPLKGNSRLLSAANFFHDIVDTFIWPNNIVRWTVVGWNLPTTQSIEYSEEKECKSFGLKCIKTIAHSVKETLMGDGTVVAPSAVDQNIQVVSLDLDNISKNEDSDISHYNVLEASSTQSIIEKIVTKDLDNKDKFSLPTGASWGEPNYDLEPDFVVVSTHSPVDLHVYDEAGNHTGIISVPTELSDNDFITGAYEKKIRGSSFRTSGDGIDVDTYIRLPFIKDKKYKIEIEGKDFGTFTFRIEKFKGSKSISKEDYSFLPVTPLMVASTTIGDIQTLPLEIDFDGNGSSDMSAIVGEEPDQYTSILAAKKMISTLLGDDRRSQQLIKRIDRMVEMLKNGKELKAKKRDNNLRWKLGHKKLKNISDNDRQQIIKIIEELFDLN